MATSGLTWIHSPEQLADDVDEWGRKTLDGVVNKFEATAPIIETWMRANANWQDNTGAARDGLTVEVTRASSLIIMTLSHGVEYGIYLELMQAGRFSILGPALAYWGSHVVESLMK